MPGIRSIQIPEFSAEGSTTVVGEETTAQRQSFNSRVYVKELPQLNQEWEVLNIILPELYIDLVELGPITFTDKTREEGETEAQVVATLNTNFTRPEKLASVSLLLKRGGQVQGMVQQQFVLPYLGIRAPKIGGHWNAEINYGQFVAMSIDLTNPILVEANEQLELKVVVSQAGGNSLPREFPNNIFAGEKLVFGEPNFIRGIKVNNQKMGEQGTLTIREVSTLVTSSHETAPPRRVK